MEGPASEGRQGVDDAPRSQRRVFKGPAGDLEARLHGPRGGHPVLLLHPHPRFGGTMGSRLVYDLAVALGQRGYWAVRFDFRGAGRSQGAYGEGEGEVEDARTVFDALAQEHGSAPFVVGFSFGGGVATRLATQRRPAGLVLVATPVRLTESRLVPLQDAPKVRTGAHVVVGSRDGFVPVEDAQRMVEALPEADLTVLEGAGHFLEPSHNARAVAAVEAALDALKGRPPGKA